MPRTPLALALAASLAALPAPARADPLVERPAEASGRAPERGESRGREETPTAEAYLARLATLDALAVEAAERAAATQEVRPRVREVATRILEMRREARRLAEGILPGRLGRAPEPTEGDLEVMGRLAAAERAVDLEEAFLDAMIAVHREAAGLTSVYRRFGDDEATRELGRLVHPLIEASLHQAVLVRQELIAEFVRAR